MNYADFNNMFDIKGLKADIEDAGKKNTSFEKTPYGSYEVVITKLELGVSKKQRPMLKVWFKIIAGQHEKSLIFMNQLLTTGFEVHKANIFLKSISENEIKFEDYDQYGKLIEDIYKEIDGKKSFELQYVNEKGYDNFIIKQVFDL